MIKQVFQTTTKISVDEYNKKNRLNVFKELYIQKNRVAKADMMIKEQDILMKEITVNRKHVSEYRKEKRKLQSCLKELRTNDADHPKIQKLSEKVDVCDKMINDEERLVESNLSKLNDFISKSNNIHAMKTPVKRRKKLSLNDSTERKRAHRSKLDDETKAKIQADNTEKHKTRRAKLDDETKDKVRAY